jgi:hypothetical protein
MSDRIRKVEFSEQLDSEQYTEYCKFLKFLHDDKKKKNQKINDGEKHVPEKIELESLEKGEYNHYCTVGDLRKFLNEIQLPDEGKVLVQRIEDSYYNTGGWGVVLKKGEFYHHAKETNRKIESGEFYNKKEYPKLTDEKIKSMFSSDEDLKFLMEQYHPAWCPVKYKDDNNLYLDLHY